MRLFQDYLQLKSQVKIVVVMMLALWKALTCKGHSPLIVRHFHLANDEMGENFQTLQEERERLEYQRVLGMDSFDLYQEVTTYKPPRTLYSHLITTC